MPGGKAGPRLGPREITEVLVRAYRSFFIVVYFCLFYFVPRLERSILFVNHFLELQEATLQAFLHPKREP